MTDTPNTDVLSGARARVSKLKGGYPDYVDDPDGLARFREQVRRGSGHDMAICNNNSLGRLIDTIERLRAERDALATPPAINAAVPAGEVECGAHALHEAEDSWNDYEWEYLPETVKDSFRDQSRHVIRALATATKVAAPQSDGTAIPVGMKAWDGSDAAPADWDRAGRVQFRNGNMIRRFEADAIPTWKHTGWGGDIIAYTPTAPKVASDTMREAGEQFAENAKNLPGIVASDTGAGLREALWLARSWVRHSDSCAIHTPVATEDGQRAECSCDYPGRIAVIDAALSTDATLSVRSNDEVLEQAARVADRHAKMGEPIMEPAAYRKASEAIAAEIRALNTNREDAQS